MKVYTICSTCIMDTTDPHIQFDEQGVCDYCNNFNDTIKPNWHTDAKGADALQALAAQIKADSKGAGF